MRVRSVEDANNHDDDHAATDRGRAGEFRAHEKLKAWSCRFPRPAIMKPTLLTPLAFILTAVVSSGLPAVPREVALSNLAARKPIDPLPPVRENRPPAATMVLKPQQHPYLFFTKESRQVLRERRAGEPFRSLAERVRREADACLGREIPPQAAMREDLPMYLPDGSYNPEYAKEEYANQFFTQSYLMREVIPPLAFAYQLTGEARYAEAGKKWLMTYAARKKFTTPGREADFHLAQVMYAMALGYDWLWEVLSEAERAQVRDLLARLSGPMHAAAKAVLARPLEKLERKVLGGNHARRTHGMYAVIPLALLYEVPGAAEWLDAEIQLHRDRLYPSGYAPNGEYLDAWDHYKSSLDDPMAFTVALARMGGENLFADPKLAPRFKGMPEYFLYGLEGRTLDRPWNDHGWSGKNEPTEIYSWLAIASACRDPVAQWIATRDGGLAKMDAFMAYLLYDPAVTLAAPHDPPGGVYFPYGGLVKLGTGWGAGDVLLPFRCGPVIAVDKGDQNAFRLRAGGEWLAPRLRDVDRLPEQTDEFNYDLMGWFWGSPAHNGIVADPDEIADYRSYRERGRIPVGGGVQYSTYTEFKNNMKPREPNAPAPPKAVYTRREEWLRGDDTPKTGDLRVVHLDSDLDYVCGEVHRAYFLIRPALSLRHVLLVKKGAASAAPYAVVCDEIESDAQARTFAWQLHAGGALELGDRRATVRGAKAQLDVSLLLPEDARLVRKQSPAPLAAERTDFVQFRTAKPEQRCVFLAVLRPRAADTVAGAWSARTIAATGGWAVEVTGPDGVDVVMFRSERAARLSAAGAEVTGTAAWLRKPNRAAAALFLLGNPAAAPGR
jgi:hypothetical protein